LLLAAWNAADNDTMPSTARRRPDSLRGYPCVSARAAQRASSVDDVTRTSENRVDHAIKTGISFQRSQNVNEL
jgi:hypothetical protein